MLRYYIYYILSSICCMTPLGHQLYRIQGECLPVSVWLSFISHVCLLHKHSLQWDSSMFPHAHHKNTAFLGRVIFPSTKLTLKVDIYSFIFIVLSLIFSIIMIQHSIYRGFGHIYYTKVLCTFLHLAFFSTVLGETLFWSGCAPPYEYTSQFLHCSWGPNT